MASASRAKSDAAIRAAAARGERTPVPVLGWLRIGLRGAATVSVLLAFLPLHCAFRALAYGSPFPKWFLYLAARICGARVNVIGTPLKRDVFFIANHISWLDILALGGASGTAYVAKVELAEVPVVGWLARLNRTVFVRRENRLGIAEQINALRDALADNWSVTVFPEGTTTDGQSLLPFKTSMMRVLEPPPPGVFVQPVVLDYGAMAEWIGWVGDEGGINNGLRILSRRGNFTLKLWFLEPFSPGEFPGRKEISATARNRIEEKLVAIRGGPLREFAHPVAPVRYQPNAAEYPIE